MVQAFGKNNHTGTETTDQSACMGNLTNAFCRLSLGVKNGTGSDDVCKALEASSVEPVRSPSRQFIKAAEEWISIEEDRDVVEAIRLDCQDEIIAEATDDGEGGGGKTSKSDVSKRQDSGDTDDDLGLGDTEGPKISEDLPLTPYVEMAESLSILEAAAEKSRVSQATYFLRKAKMA